MELFVNASIIPGLGADVWDEAHNQTWLPSGVYCDVFMQVHSHGLHRDGVYSYGLVVAAEWCALRRLHTGI